MTDTCEREVTRAGVAEPCGAPATFLADDPDGGPYPACFRHASRRLMFAEHVADLPGVGAAIAQGAMSG